MNSPAQEHPVWTSGRLLGVAGGFFVLQVGLIVLFGARGAGRTVTPAPSTQFRAAEALMTRDQLMRLFFTSDPAAFAWPSPQGFSGRAWMDQPPARFQSTNQLEAPRWLALDASQLGNGPEISETSEVASPWTSATTEIPQLEPMPVFLSPVIIPTQSVFHVEGELAKRLIGPAPALHSWPAAGRNLLTNSVVQIAVTPAGDVLAARLLSRSGSADADGDAMAGAQALRFRPSADKRTAWAQAVFAWQTTFPATTGAPP